MLYLVQHRRSLYATSLHFLVCCTLLYPSTGSMVALHHREKGNPAAFTSIAQYNLSLQLVMPAVGFRPSELPRPILPRPRSASVFFDMAVLRLTTARDLDAPSLAFSCLTLRRVTERGVQSHRDLSMSHCS